MKVEDVVDGLKVKIVGRSDTIERFGWNHQMDAVKTGRIVGEVFALGPPGVSVQADNVFDAWSYAPEDLEPVIEAPLEVTLVDYTSEEGASIDVIIKIDKQGIEISPKLEEQRYNGIFPREIWVEFYLGTLQVHVWDGTQEDPVTQEILQP